MIVGGIAAGVPVAIAVWVASALQYADRAAGQIVYVGNLNPVAAQNALVGIFLSFGPMLIGDAINLAVRLEQHARVLGTRIVVGNELMQRARCECGGGAELTKFVEAGARSISGRVDPVNVWVQAGADDVAKEALRTVALA